MLGGPTIATSKPSLILSAAKDPSISDFISIWVLLIKSRTSGVTSVGMSSSAKSIVASIRLTARIKSFLHICTFLDRAPSIDLTARRR